MDNDKINRKRTSNAYESERNHSIRFDISIKGLRADLYTGLGEHVHTIDMFRSCSVMLTAGITRQLGVSGGG